MRAAFLFVSQFHIENDNKKLARVLFSVFFLFFALFSAILSFYSFFSFCSLR